MGYEATWDGPRYAKQELEQQEQGEKTIKSKAQSANLINVPAPINSNAKRFLTVETTWIETKEVKNQFRDFAVWFRPSSATPYCLMISSTARITDKTRSL